MGELFKFFRSKLASDCADDAADWDGAFDFAAGAFDFAAGAVGVAVDVAVDAGIFTRPGVVIRSQVDSGLAAGDVTFSMLDGETVLIDCAGLTGVATFESDRSCVVLAD